MEDFMEANLRHWDGLTPIHENSSFYDGSDATDLVTHYPYFHSAEPKKFEPDGTGSYADRSVPVSTTTYEWSHGMGDILNSLLSAGLTIEYLHEFPYSMYEQLPNMTLDVNGRWRLQERESSVPLTFSIQGNQIIAIYLLCRTTIKRL